MEHETSYAIRKAMELFDQQQYREALAAFTEIYNHCEIISKRREIFQMLEEAYYTPNIDELRNNYEKNLAVLQKYPYFWGQDFPQYDDLSIQLFPASDEFFYPYDRKKDFFSNEYDAKTSNQMKYFFENLDHPIQVTDEDNFYNLNFLNDNVRASEDFAGDNHIYLFYDSPEPLQRLMLVCDLEPILTRQKFVFLIGKQNQKHYPINFKKDFGIDYSKMKPTPIRIEEIKRVCFWFAKHYCGTLLSLSVLNASNEIQVINGAYFNKNSTINGEVISNLSEYKKILFDGTRKYSVNELSEIFNSSNCDLRLDVYTEEQELEMAQKNNYNLKFNGGEEYLDWLRKYRSDSYEYSLKELFCAYFLWQYEKRKLNPRISPMLVYDPHVVLDPSLYSNLILSFPYYVCMTSVRNPIVVLTRHYKVGMTCGDRILTLFRIGGEYVEGQLMHPELQKCYYGFRFEDLKTKPEIVCRAVCKHLNIPYEPQMLKADAPWPDRDVAGGTTRGFDQAPLHRDLSFMLSDFDQLRLKMFYDPILRHYGYPSFPFDEHPLPDELVRELFKYPFHFEYTNHTKFINPPSRENLHSWIQEILQGAWKKSITVPTMIPLEEINNE